MKYLISIAGIASSLLLSLPSVAQTRNENIAQEKSDVIYTQNADGTVTDESTGLIWAKCTLGFMGVQCDELDPDVTFPPKYSWQEALQAAQTANNRNYLGHHDWRLPNRIELSTLIEPACFGPVINEEFFPNTPFDMPFWTSTPSTIAANASFVEFTNGNGGVNQDKNSSLYVRLVRGGHE